MLCLLACLSLYLAALKDMKPSFYSWCRYLLVGSSILHWSGRPLTLHPDMGAVCPFHSPLHFVRLALPAMTQFSEWQHSSFGSLSASINGYRCHPSALHTCPSGGLQPNHPYLESSPIFSGHSSRCP